MTATAAIELRDLKKTFGRGKDRVQALRGIDLNVAPGQVYGFLGPNGAGKSTTIRILMGLLRASSGQAMLLGQSVGHKVGPRERVGALIEGATFYPFLTGRQNLEILADTAGVSREQIDPLLDQVQLAGRADRKVSGFSTGMKQRLGLAAALLGEPELIILDEPTNGLDPAGITYIRELIRSLVHDGGRTVFLSSHILHEVEQICHRVAIINQGRLVREGPVDELLSQEAGYLSVKAEPLERAESLLMQHWQVSRQQEWLHVFARPEEGPDIARLLTTEAIKLYQLKAESNTLESYFLSATNEEVDHVAA